MKLTRRRSFVALLIGLVAATTACGDDDDEASDDAQTVAAGVASSTVPGASLELSQAVVLTRDGLGVASFGQGAEEAIAAVTAVLGEPTEDTGWVDPLTISSCTGTQARSVAWRALYLYFSDESSVASGRQHFFGFSYGIIGDLEAAPQGLSTAEGIGLGTSVEFLRAAYPEVAVEPGEEGIIEPSFSVDANLSGRLTGVENDDLVTVIIGGNACALGM